MGLVMFARSAGIILRLLLMGLGFAVSLGLAEVVVRISDLAPDVGVVRSGRFAISADPLIGYEPVGTGEMVPGVLNGRGYRDRERRKRVSDETKRVVVIGDSIGDVYGLPTYDQGFVWKLEKRLNMGKRQVDVVNLSVLGYNTQQEVALLSNIGLSYRPDLVIVAYCLNDRERHDGFVMGRLRQVERAQLETGTLDKARLSSTLANSKLYVLGNYLFQRQHRQSGAVERISEERLLSVDTVAESFARLAALSTEHNFQVLVVVFPYLWDLNEYSYSSEHEFVATLVKRHQFKLLDLLEPFKDCARQDGQILTERVRLDRFHPNEHGHRCAADALAAEIPALIFDKVGTE